MSNSLVHSERRRLRAREKAKQNRVRRNGSHYGHGGGVIAGRPLPGNPLERNNLVAAILAVRKFFGGKHG